MAKRRKNSTKGSGEANWRGRRLRQLLARAAEDPAFVLQDPRCRKKAFCEAFFELCDDRCLQVGYAGALEFARYAVQLAERIGDPHLIHHGQGVLVHAHIAACDLPGATDVLRDYRLSAFACCSTCSGDWLRREGDLLVELGDAEGAQQALASAAEHLGPALDADAEGRLGFLRGIAFHKSRDGEKALAEAGRALHQLDLTTPKGYFLDTLGFVACYLQFRPQRILYTRALNYLESFRQRLKGLEDWTDVRLRLSWVEALVLARLGQRKKAVARLERVFDGLFDSAPPKHVLAVAIDLAQLFAHRASDTDLRAIRRLVTRCRRFDLDASKRRCLRVIQRVASQRPDQVLEALSAFRFTFKVPVPGLLSEGRAMV